jgi:two-component system, chemotaxis family, chemotaxis protein CheY
VRILIVDDSRAMRLILKRMLGEMGYSDVAEAEDGAVALTQMEAFKPELALVDWNMPVMNGLEFVTAVRESREYDKVKMMMVTSESSPRLVYEALKAGADEYAMKPITRDVIEEKLMILGLS